MNPQKYAEKILVVPREKLFQGATLTGFNPMPSFSPWQQVIEQHKQFLARGDMEQDPSYKQIIPYLIFSHNNKYFLMERKATASEQRLQSKKSLGIGGHIRQEDLDEKDIIGWAKREFAEEIFYQGSMSIQPLGIINDDSNEVGKVHIGFAFLIQGDSDNISIKSELKSGQLLTLEQCQQHYNNMETWSQLVVDYLVSQATKGTSMSTDNIKFLEHKALNIRINSVKATTASKSGHPTSCLSAADMVSALFFTIMKHDINNPEAVNNDRFIISKGHAVPVVYAAYKELGIISEEELLSLRKFDSTLEGHPTPRFAYNQAATGSLGQGLGIGVGMAIAAKQNNLSYTTYVMMGDGEIAEGSIWEAAELASHEKLNNLVGIVDANRLAQSGSAIEDHDVATYAKRFEAFGWETTIIDGHNMQEIVATLSAPAAASDKPRAIIAKTFKGYGLENIEDKEGFHGKPFNDEQLLHIIDQLKQRFKDAENPSGTQACMPRNPENNDISIAAHKTISLDLATDPNVKEFVLGTHLATRKAYGYALASLGRANKDVVALDADVKNSTFTEIFEKEHPQRFTQCYIAEQNMVSVSTGLQSCGKIPFCATFAAFFTRAHDQLRMAAIGRNALRVCGSHAGVSIGEDGPSQMGLEDLAMMRCIPESIVLYPSDGVSTYKLTQQMANYHNGISYLRTTRASTPNLYDLDEDFPVGGCKIVKQSKHDQLCILAAGITLHEALKAHKLLLAEGINTSVVDVYSVKPLDVTTIRSIAQQSGNKIITVEDHYPQGGLGEAIAKALVNFSIQIRMLSVSQISRSGSPEELLRHAEIDAHSIISAVQNML